MKTTFASLPAAALVLLAIAPFPAEAQSRCARPDLTPAETVACAKAREDIAELRRYVFRTRMIYSLHLPLYAALQTPAPVAQQREERAPERERDDVASVSR